MKVMLRSLRKKVPKDDKQLLWTEHVKRKMRHYQLSEGRIRRILRSPKRSEKGIAPGTTALMQPASGYSRGEARPKGGPPGKKRHRDSEIWLMYQKVGRKKRIITAWRYPGKSPRRDVIPIPEDILEEVEALFRKE